MADTGEPSGGFDVFLSHGTPDKPWVGRLRDELEALGLRAFLDEVELRPGGNWLLTLSEDLLRSRCLALVLTRGTLARPWVEHEWASFMAEHGPRSGRILPVLLDPVDLPTFLKPLQAIHATHRDPARVARELAALVGRLDELPEGDARRLFIGQDLVFVLGRQGDRITVADPTGRRREVDPPWALDARFTVARLEFARLTREALGDDAARAELHGHAAALGGLLFDLLFDEPARELLRQATLPGRPRPLVGVWSDDDVLLSLPWELLHHDGRFLVRDAVVDLVRSVPGEVGPGAILRPPTGPFSLVVNVSAPEGSGLDHEHESYRLTLALADQCPLTPTELGTVDDLVATVRDARPAGIHFSGHGSPGRLLFEDDLGRDHLVPVEALLDRLRQGLPDGQLPPFFYLANCHGNDPDPGAPEEGRPGAVSLAARLHRAGVGQVVGYHGPILDRLSTEAEAALYAAIAAGHSTHFAVRQARAAMARPPGDDDRAVFREPSTDPGRAIDRTTHPFAWSQLVLYHRGHDYPLSTPPPPGRRRHDDTAPRRAFVDAGTRRILQAGFIGRRRELHDLRRRHRAGQRVYVLQGLGGLGKSTLALHMLRQILHAGDDLCTLWCQDAEKAETPEGIATVLVGQFLEFCRKRFGADWESVVQQVDRTAGDDPARRFEAFLGTLLENVERLVLYLDNLESLLVGPAEVGAGRPDPDTFGTWRTPTLEALWSVLTRFAEGSDRLHVVASCRYRNTSFRPQVLIPVSPLPAGALFRLMGWFPGLRRLSTATRARLVGLLDGHPRAVEYANDLVEHALDAWEERHGPWRLPDPPVAADLAREWDELVGPALPRVQGRLWDNLLLGAIWDHVLDDRAHRMLFRMTLLRQPWDWDLVRELGEAGDPAAAEQTAARLRRTSLLEQVELFTPSGPIRRSTIHPATAEYVARRSGDDPPLRDAAHLRVGTYYEARANTSPHVEDYLEAGHHLFQSGEYDRSNELLGPASRWLREHGRVREGLQLLEPFLAEPVRRSMRSDRVGRLLGTVGLAYAALGQAERAIGFYEQVLAIAREDGDRRGEGNALGSLGNAYADLGQAERAINFHEQRLAIAREVGDRRGEGNALGNLGNAYFDLGQAERAIGFYEQVLAIAREDGDRRGEGDALGNLGAAYADLGQAERAINFHEQRLAIAREVGDRGGEGQTLGNLGNAYAALGQAERAIGFYEQDLAIAREVGDRRGEGQTLGNLGAAYADLDQAERAIGLLEQAAQIGREINDPRLIQFATEKLKHL